jgi:mRNA interferase MazF
MLSFRVPDDQAAEAQRWAEALGVDRSELLREALRRHLVGLRAAQDAAHWRESGDRRRSGATGPMRRGEIWFAATPGGDRPVLVLTRDPVADSIGAVVVAALTRTRRDLVSELTLTPDRDGVPTDCVVNFDNVHTVPRAAFRRRVATLSAARMAEACRTLSDAMGC